MVRYRPVRDFCSDWKRAEQACCAVHGSKGGFPIAVDRSVSESNFPAGLIVDLKAEILEPNARPNPCSHSACYSPHGLTPIGAEGSPRPTLPNFLGHCSSRVGSMLEGDRDQSSALAYTASRAPIGVMPSTDASTGWSEVPRGDVAERACDRLQSATHPFLLSITVTTVFVERLRTTVPPAFG
ncbi:hypothetical protein ACVWWR_005412 [Bradyrhizobium sp. LM3.2]